MVMIPAPSGTKGGAVDLSIPPIKAERFGIVQESLWTKPFWLLVAVVLLNQTGGKKAIPAVGELARQYQKPENLACADQADICEIIHHLGLQNQRSATLIKMAKAWVADPPTRGKRYGTPRYPTTDDRSHPKGKPVEGDADDCAGALEIGHIPGCGPYAWDSWRIFCRDALRGVADDYNGRGARPGFEPEWKRVEPLDKELRACLRWMWLRDGWVWDDRTYQRRRATADDMLRVSETFTDQRELAMAAQAAVALELSTEGQALVDGTDGGISVRDSVMSKSAVPVTIPKGRRPHRAEPPARSHSASKSRDSANAITAEPVRQRRRSTKVGRLESSEGMSQDDLQVSQEKPLYDEPGWQCSTCARAFTSQRGLNAHTRIKHGPNVDADEGSP